MVRLVVILTILLLSTQLHAKPAVFANYSINLNDTQHPIESTVNLWQRQAISINMDIYSRKEFYFLKSHDNDNPDFKIVDLPSEQAERVIVDNETYYRRQIRFVAWPLRAGQQQLILTGVDYITEGKKQLSFTPPAIDVDVNALPPYIPPDFPVGRFSINTEIDSGHFLAFLLTPGRLSYLNVSIDSESIPTEWLPSYTRKINRYPAQILKPEVKQSIKRIQGSLLSENKYRYPVIAENSGILKSEAIKLAYFDPITGRIISTEIKLPIILSLNLYLQSVLSIFGLVLLYKIFELLFLFNRNYMFRRQLWRRICESDTPHQLNQSLRQLTPAFGWFSKQYIYQQLNLTLYQWRLQWNAESRYQELDNKISELYELCYSTKSSDIEFSELKKDLIKIIARKDHWPISLRGCNN